MITLVLIGVLTFLYILYYQIKFNYWRRRGINGPKVNPWFPFLGTILEEISLPSNEIEEKFLKQYGQIFGTYAGSQPILNISNPEHIKQVLSDLKTFPSGGTFDFNDKYLSQSMFFESGHEWKMTRAAQTRYFTSKNFRNLLFNFENITNNFMDDLSNEIKESKTGDIDIDCKVLFALDSHAYKQRDSTFVKSSCNLGDVSTIQAILVTMLPRPVSKFLGINTLNFEPMDKLGDYLKGLLRKRKETGIKYNDLSELLQDAVIDEKTKLSEDQMVGNVLLAFFAGVEAVSNAISYMFYYLAENPDVQEKLYNEIVKDFSEDIKYETLTQNEYLDAVVNEVLRLQPAFLSVGRQAAKDVQIGDYKIEKGTGITVILYLPNVSEEHYTDPHAFNPDRFLNKEAKKDHLFAPFGFGPKQCLGMRLATIETKYLFVRLLQRYEILKAKGKRIHRISVRAVNGTDVINVSFKERV